MIKDWKIKIFLLLFYVNSLCIYSDEYVLQNIPIEFTGTYIPVQYDNILKSTRNHFQAMLSNKRHYHDILLLDNDQCRSNAGFHDGYAIQKSEFKDFSRLLTNPAVSRLYNDKRVITYIIGSNRCADL